MAEFISSFITGFQDVIQNDLPQKLKGCKIINIFDGLVHYQYNGNSRDLEKILYFNNTLFVLKTWKDRGLNFSSMVGTVSSEKKYYLINRGSFRVRFIQENTFSKVDKNISRKAEETVLRNSNLHLDRLSPSTEIWYSIRRENFAFCGQLISKREFTEKNLKKGELRPEIAYLICRFAEIDFGDVILEPFCGYGSIPVQLIKNFRFSKLFASDIDKEKIEALKENKLLHDSSFFELKLCDALKLDYVQNSSIDVVLTDPPWGYYEDIGDIFEFYSEMFDSLNRVLKSNGKIIILTARKEEFEKVSAEKGFKIKKSLHTLVNGKKASVYYLIKND